MINVENINQHGCVLGRDLRKQFPLLAHNSFIYLDSASTAQKPESVITAMDQFYAEHNANVHRGVYELSQRATVIYEAARTKVQHWIGAKHAHEIILTGGATESLNMVALGLKESNYFRAGDEILISAMEHHSNLVPWQRVCQQTGATLKIIPLTADYSLDMDAFHQLLSPKTRLLAVTHVSNVLGGINPIEEMTQAAHQVGALVLIDGTQAVPHMAVDMQSLDCDFYAFSSHKIYGPTGVGILYGKTVCLELLEPMQTGGSMISTVSFEKTEFAPLPVRLEAGTPNIAGVIGLGAAIDFMARLGMENIERHEAALMDFALQELRTIPGLTVFGNYPVRKGVISFAMEHVHPHDIATILDTQGVALRAGHHCAMPLMSILNVPATARISLAVYNEQEDIIRLVKGLRTAMSMFGLSS